MLISQASYPDILHAYVLWFTLCEFWKATREEWLYQTSKIRKTPCDPDHVGYYWQVEVQNINQNKKLKDWTTKFLQLIIKKCKRLSNENKHFNLETDHFFSIIHVTHGWSLWCIDIGCFFHIWILKNEEIFLPLNTDV